MVVTAINGRISFQIDERMKEYLGPKIGLHPRDEVRSSQAREGRVMIGMSSQILSMPLAWVVDGEDDVDHALAFRGGCFVGVALAEDHGAIAEGVVDSAWKSPDDRGEFLVGCDSRALGTATAGIVNVGDG